MNIVKKWISVMLSVLLAVSVFPMSILSVSADDSDGLIGISGDVNQDGAVDISDATYIQKYIVKMISLTDDQKSLADVDGNGISVADASVIQKYIVEYDVSDTTVGNPVYRKSEDKNKVYINEDFSNEENFPSGQAPSYADWGLESQKQNKWKSTGDVTVTGAEGSRYVRIAGQNRPAELMLDFSDQPLSGTVEIEAVINLKTRGTGSPCLLEIWDTSDTPNKLLSMNSPNSSVVQINDGAWKQILSTDVTDTFHRYVIRINTEKKTHEMWIDGMFIGSYSIRNTDLFSGEIGSVSIYGEGASKNSGQILLDSIKITEYTKHELSVPTGLYADSFSDSSVSLKWNAVDEADSYAVYRNGKFCAEVFENSFDDTNLKNDTEYTYTVAAKNSDGEFDLSSPVTVKTLYNENSRILADQNFENCSVGNFEAENWETLKTGNASVSIAAIPVLYDKSLLLTAGRNEKAECTLNFDSASDDSKIIIDMDMMVDGEGNKFSCAPYISDSQGRQILKFGFRDGYFSAFNDADDTSKAENIIKYERGRWYSIRIIYNPVSNYYSVYADGELITSVDGSKILVPGSAPSSITFRTDNVDGNTNNYINDIRVTASESSDVTKVKFEKDSYKLYEGEIYQPNVYFTDKDGDNVCRAYNTEFSSQNSDVVKINETSGEINALQKGTAQITVKSQYNGKELENTAVVSVENSSDIPAPQSLCAVTVRNYSLELAWNDMGGVRIFCKTRG